MSMMSGVVAGQLLIRVGKSGPMCCSVPSRIRDASPRPTAVW